MTPIWRSKWSCSVTRWPFFDAKWFDLLCDHRIDRVGARNVIRMPEQGLLVISCVNNNMGNRDQ